MTSHPEPCARYRAFLNATGIPDPAPHLFQLGADEVLAATSRAYWSWIGQQWLRFRDQFRHPLWGCKYGPKPPQPWEQEPEFDIWLQQEYGQ